MKSKLDKYDKLLDSNLIRMYFSLDKSKYASDLDIIEQLLRGRFNLSVEQSLYDPEVKEKLDRVVFESDIGDPKMKDVVKALKVLISTTFLLVLVTILILQLDIYQIPLSVITFLMGTLLLLEHFRSKYTGLYYEHGLEIDRRKHPTLNKIHRITSLLFGLFGYLITILLI